MRLWGYCIYTEMCFNNKYKNRKLQRGCYKITKKKQAENEKQAFFERLYWAVFQFFMQKYYTWQNNTSWYAIISTKKHDAVKPNFIASLSNILIAR